MRAFPKKLGIKARTTAGTLESAKRGCDLSIDVKQVSLQFVHLIFNSLDHLKK